MPETTQKKRKTTTVRIYEEPKERLQNVAREKSAKEKREVTELELTSAAVEAFCRKEERKLGIHHASV